MYYVGLLAGENDIELVESTRLGRNINRHNYTLEEVAQEVKKPVVKRLLRLMKFRNSHPAFNGDLSLFKSEDDSLHLEWNHDGHTATADINIKTFKVRIEHNTGPETQAVAFNA